MIRVLEITEHSSIVDFDFWDGADITIQAIIDAGKIDELNRIAENRFSDEFLTHAELNDWLWFDKDEIFAELGIKDK